MQNYIKSAQTIFESGDKKVYAFSVIKKNKKKFVRLHACSGNDISAPIELSRSKLDDIRELVDYMDLDEKRDIRLMKQTLKACWFSLPRLVECENIGFQKNQESEIKAYMGARCFDNKGGRMLKDEFASLPKCKGSMENVVKMLNAYMGKNIKRQIVLAHALSGAVCGILDRNIILSLVSESSKGKTTIQKMGASFFAQTNYSGTFLKWSATQNALIKRMDGLSGLNVLIDDTQLSNIRQFAPIIYSFENGQSIDRLVKGNSLCQSYKWSVSIGITAEKSLLDTFSELGAVARMIEMPLHDVDLFDNEREVHEIQNLYEENYGVVGTEFVRYLLLFLNREGISGKVKKEGQRLCKVYGNRIAGNTVLKRHLESDIAIMVVTAALANNFLGFRFQIPLLRSVLLSLCEENYRTFEQNKFENAVTEIVYIDILATGREMFPENERDGKIIIPSNIMKVLLSKYATALKVKSARIKD